MARAGDILWCVLLREMSHYWYRRITPVFTLFLQTLFLYMTASHTLPERESQQLPGYIHLPCLERMQVSCNGFVSATSFKYTGALWGGDIRPDKSEIILKAVAVPFLASNLQQQPDATDIKPKAAPRHVSA